MKKIKFLLVVFFLTTLGATAQVKIGDNPTSLNGDAVLEMESTDKGLLLPRVALTSTSAFAPLSAHVQGMTVYNTATAGDVTPGYYYNNGTKWVRLADATSFANADATKDAWVDDATNSVVKLGTKSDGTTRDAKTEVVVTDDGKVGLGTENPTAKFVIEDNSTSTIVQSVVKGDNWISQLLQGGKSSSLLLATKADGSKYYKLGTYEENHSNQLANKFFIATPSNKKPFVITDEGYVGIDTKSPTEKLEVVGSVKIVDGTQGVDKLFVSDADGKGSWKSATEVGLGGATNNGLWEYDGTVAKLSTLSDGSTARPIANNIFIADNGHIKVGDDGSNTTTNEYKFHILDNVAQQVQFALTNKNTAGYSRIGVYSGSGRIRINHYGKDANVGSVYGLANVGGLGSIFNQRGKNFLIANFTGDLSLGVGQPSSSTGLLLNLISDKKSVGVGTQTPEAKLDVNGYVKVGSSDANGDTTPKPGMIRYNADKDKFQGYTQSSGWVDLH